MALQTDERYTIHEQIGRGSFGEVFRGVDNETGEIVAIKVIDLDQVRPVQRCGLAQVTGTAQLRVAGWRRWPADPP